MAGNPLDLVKRGVQVATKAVAKRRRQNTGQHGRVDVSTTAERIRERRAAEAAILRIKDSPGYNIEVKEPTWPIGEGKLSQKCHADTHDSTDDHADPTIR